MVKQLIIKHGEINKLAHDNDQKNFKNEIDPDFDQGLRGFPFFQEHKKKKKLFTHSDFLVFLRSFCCFCLIFIYLLKNKI